MQKIMLAPSIRGGGSVHRIILIGDTVTVLDVDGLHRDLSILKRVNPGYYYATKTWQAAAGLILVAGILLSFTWVWWAFIPGSVIVYAVFKANAMSVADFGAQTIVTDPAFRRPDARGRLDLGDLG